MELQSHGHGLRERSISAHIVSHARKAPSSTVPNLISLSPSRQDSALHGPPRALLCVNREPQLRSSLSTLLSSPSLPCAMCCLRFGSAMCFACALGAPCVRAWDAPCALSALRVRLGWRCSALAHVCAEAHPGSAAGISCSGSGGHRRGTAAALVVSRMHPSRRGARSLVF